jgi:S1-C subfamily serine protease
LQLTIKIKKPIINRFRSSGNRIRRKQRCRRCRIKKGDIITQIDTTPITDFADLSIAIGSKRPGDKVTVTYQRNGKPYTTTVTLRDQKGGTSTRTKADLSVTEKIGADFQSIDDKTKAYYGLNSGVIAKNVVEGGEMAKAGIVDGYIITEINGKPVNSQKDVENILNKFRNCPDQIYG